MLKIGSTILSGRLPVLTMGGGLVFWAVTVATSLLPIAAEYRAAYSNAKVQTVWVASLFVGLLTAFVVSYFVLRSLNRAPTKNAILESAELGSIALAAAAVLIDVPMGFHQRGQSGALYYFVVGAMFDAARFLFLGLAVGYLYQRLYGRDSRESAHRAVPCSKEKENELAQ